MRSYIRWCACAVALAFLVPIQAATGADRIVQFYDTSRLPKSSFMDSRFFLREQNLIFAKVISADTARTDFSVAYSLDVIADYHNVLHHGDHATVVGDFDSTIAPIPRLKSGALILIAAIPRKRAGELEFAGPVRVPIGYATPQIVEQRDVTAIVDAMAALRALVPLSGKGVVDFKAVDKLLMSKSYPTWCLGASLLAVGGDKAHIKELMRIVNANDDLTVSQAAWAMYAIGTAPANVQPTARELYDLLDAYVERQSGPLSDLYRR